MWLFGDFVGSENLRCVSGKFNTNVLTYLTIFFTASSVFIIDMLVRRQKWLKLCCCRIREINMQESFSSLEKTERFGRRRHRVPKKPKKVV
jgi:hypothetical protein